MSVKITLTEDRIEQQSVDPTEIGAVLEYRHVIRQSESGSRIAAIDFDGDREYIEDLLAKLASKIADEYDLPSLECIRRIGTVEPGECCLLVRIQAAHPKEAFRSMWEFLESLKRIEIPSEIVAA